MVSLRVIFVGFMFSPFFAPGLKTIKNTTGDINRKNELKKTTFSDLLGKFELLLRCYKKISNN